MVPWKAVLSRLAPLAHPAGPKNDMQFALLTPLAGIGGVPIVAPVMLLSMTDERAPKGFAPAAIGLCLTLIHLIGIPVTNVSVNPARSTGPALFAGGWALQELWLFWVAPLVGGALGGLIYNALFGSKGKTIDALEATPIAAKVRA